MRKLSYQEVKEIKEGILFVEYKGTDLKRKTCYRGKINILDNNYMQLRIVFLDKPLENYMEIFEWDNVFLNGVKMLSIREMINEDHHQYKTIYIEFFEYKKTNKYEMING